MTLLLFLQHCETSCTIRCFTPQIGHSQKRQHMANRISINIFKETCIIFEKKHLTLRHPASPVGQRDAFLDKKERRLPDVISSDFESRKFRTFRKIKQRRRPL